MTQHYDINKSKIVDQNTKNHQIHTKEWYIITIQHIKTQNNNLILQNSIIRYKTT